MSGEIPASHFASCSISAAAEPAVETLREALEVDVHGIDIRKQLFPRLRLNLAVGHQHDGKILFFEQFRRVEDKFIANQRLIVREGHADIARSLFKALRGRRDFSRRHCLYRQLRILKIHTALHVLAASLRDAVILAERTAQVAAKAAE